MIASTFFLEACPGLPLEVFQGFPSLSHAPSALTSSALRTPIYMALLHFLFHATLPTIPSFWRLFLKSFFFSFRFTFLSGHHSQKGNPLFRSACQTLFLALLPQPTFLGNYFSYWLSYLSYIITPSGTRAFFN